MRSIRRVQDFRDQLAGEVAAAVAAGMSVAEAAIVAGVIRQTVYTWCSAHSGADHQASL